MKSFSRRLLPAFAAALVFAFTLTFPAVKAAEMKVLGNSALPYSTGVTVTPGGPLLFTSGGGGGNTGDTKTQALTHFANLKKSLETYGYSLENIAFVHAALVADENGKVDFEGWNAAWAEVFPGKKPAQTTIVIPKFWAAGAKISELDAVCVAGSAETMIAASKALNFPVTNPTLAPFEARKGRFYRAMGVVPGTSLFFASGVGAPVVNKEAPPNSRESRGDMHTQATGILKLIQANLATVGLSFNDVVFMRAYIGPDTFDGGKFGYDEWNKTYDEFFNTAENPHKPARTSISIAGFTNPAAMLEVEVIAAFPSTPALFAEPDAGNANLKTYGKPEAAIASGIAVKGTSALYFSAGAGPTVSGDMQTQALSALATIKSRLEAAGYGMKDVVFLHAFIVGDKDGKVDRKGWTDAYVTQFGSKDQPHKPARTTIAISALPNPDWKIQLEVIAAKP